MITIRFSEPANYTNGAQGITITNTTTDKDYIITAVDGDGTDTITYGGYWETEPVYGEVIQWTASGTDYTSNEGVSLSNQTITLTNCTPEVNWVLGFDGTNYAELSEPFYGTDDYEIEVDFSLGEGTLAMPLIGGSDGTTNSLVIDASNGSSRVRAFGYAGGVLLDILTVTASLPFGSKHTAKLSVVGGEATISCDGVVGSTETWGDHPSAFADYIARDSSAYLNGSVYEVRITDNTTPANSASWELNSGPPVYVEGENVIVNGTFDTNLDGWIQTTAAWQWVDGRAHHPLGDETKLLRGGISSDLQGKTAVIEFDYEVTEGIMRVMLRSDVNGALPTIGTFSGTGHFRVVVGLPDDVGYVGFYRDQPETPTEGYIDNVTVKEVQGIVSDGTIFEPTEEYGIEESIIRPDEWSTVAGATSSGYTVTYDGSQLGDSVVQANSLDEYSGFIIMVSNAYGGTVGSVKGFMGNSSTPLIDFRASGVETIHQTSTDATIAVQCDSNSFDGSIEVIQVNPVPKGLIYHGVEEIDWSEQ